eukprot:TRINITY_DN6906_c0_g1_i1.p2 TRINITY_DN6906_c0_g1~~TRINITY_DN6906_c0_g1_i1.p2  ORF type:complete len:107 (-),score=17.62 TRINITY_DN6906_c0_g1_i1:20-340(-)
MLLLIQGLALQQQIRNNIILFQQFFFQLIIFFKFWQRNKTFEMLQTYLKLVGKNFEIDEQTQLANAQVLIKTIISNSHENEKCQNELHQQQQEVNLIEQQLATSFF